MFDINKSAAAYLETKTIPLHVAGRQTLTLLTTCWNDMEKLDKMHTLIVN